MNDQELLIQYLQGELSAEETRALEARLRREPELSAELTSLQDLLKGIELEGDEQLKTSLSRVENRLDQEGFFETKKPAKKVFLGFDWQKLSAAAAVLLLLGAWIFFQSKPRQTEIVTTPPAKNQDSLWGSVQRNIRDTAPTPQTPTQQPPQKQSAPDQLLALATKSYRTPAFSDYRSTNGRNAIDSAAYLYRTAQYPAMLRYVNRQPAEYQNQTRTKLFKAHAYLSMKQFGQALPILQQVVDSDEMPFSEESEYDLLLCYLANYGQYKAKFEQLSKKILADDGHPDFKRVLDLTAEMPR